MAYSASANWSVPCLYNGRTGHYGAVQISVDDAGRYSSGGHSTPNGPLDEAQAALHWLFAGDASDEAGILLSEDSLGQWLEGYRTTAVVRYNQLTFRFSQIQWKWS